MTAGPRRVPCRACCAALPSAGSNAMRARERRAWLAGAERGNGRPWLAVEGVTAQRHLRHGATLPRLVWAHATAPCGGIAPLWAHSAAHPQLSGLHAPLPPASQADASLCSRAHCAAIRPSGGSCPCGSYPCDSCQERLKLAVTRDPARGPGLLARPAHRARPAREGCRRLARRGRHRRGLARPSRRALLRRPRAAIAAP
jgi:hypothetical protein